MVSHNLFNALSAKSELIYIDIIWLVYVCGFKSILTPGNFVNTIYIFLSNTVVCLSDTVCHYFSELTF